MREFDRAALLRMAPSALLACVIDATIERMTQPNRDRQIWERMLASNRPAATKDESPF